MSHDSRKRTSHPAWTDDIQTLMADQNTLNTGTVTLEFPDGSDKLTVSRREFLRVAAVAAAGAGVTAGCEVPVEKVVPYAKRPDDVYFVAPNSYTSVCRDSADHSGVLMQVREGRVLKLEGNPQHPSNAGKLSAAAQASVIDVYSPDRVYAPLKTARAKTADGVYENGKAKAWDWAKLPKMNSTWDALDKDIAGALKKTSKVRVLTGFRSGPAETQFMTDFLGLFADAKHTAWEPLGASDSQAAMNAGYGQPNRPKLRLDRAKAIVSIGHAFLDRNPDGIEATRQYASTRNVPEQIKKEQAAKLKGDKLGLISHLTVFEGRLTLTGIAADTRHRVRPSDLLYAGLGLANALIVGQGVAAPAAVKQALGAYDHAKVAGDLGLDPKAFADAAELLKKAGKRAVVTAAHFGAIPGGAALEGIVAIINEALQSQCIERDQFSIQHSANASPKSTHGWASLQELTKDLNSGTVDVLIVHNSNPVYATPPDLKFAEAMAKAKKVVVVDSFLTETGAAADWVAAGSHWLESWGDSAAHSNLYCIQQPGMQPVGNTRSFEDCLMVWTRDLSVGSDMDKALAQSAAYSDEWNRPTPGAWYFYIRNHWEKVIFAAKKRPASFTTFWDDVLKSGALQVNDKTQPLKPINAAKAIAGIQPRKAPSGMQLELFAPIGIGDGRHATNGVLQEMPDPVTQVTWGNYAALSPKKFTEMGLAPGDLLDVKNDAGKSLKLPAVMMPGLPDDVVAVPLGYGRTIAGVVGSDLGGDAYQLAKSTPQGPMYAGIPATVTKAGGNDPLGIPDGKGHLLDLHDRPIVPLTSLEEYIQDQGAGIHMHNMPGLWPKHDYREVKWGMAIDLSLCTGCSACVTACQIENNIPVVGKQGVIEGRGMYWMRIDRYYKLPENADHAKTSEAFLTQNPSVAAAEYLENPTVLLEPMLCQHCDNAPCETVCPVLATVHSSDGLNEQVYNRCVGTRYCANNCPYKVRRFNWYNYSADRSEEFFAEVFPELKTHAVLNAVWPLPLHFNPEVTVRTRGVMEKCSFCVQRIRKGTEVSKKLGIDQPIQTACQQTCPANAITFGNTLDNSSEVAKKMHVARNFKVLEHLGVEPAVRYLTRVRNVPPSPNAGHGHAPSTDAKPAGTPEKAH